MSVGLADRGELRELLTQLAADQLAAPGAHRLNELLKHDAAARDFYRRFQLVDALLQWEYAEPTPATVQSESREAQRIETQQDEATHLLRAGRYAQLWTVPLQAVRTNLAAALMIAGLTVTIIVLSLALIVPDWERAAPVAVTPSTEFVARIARTSQADFDKTSGGSFQNRDLFDDDTIVLNAGLAVIEYDTGARVVLEGPAVYHVAGANGGDLRVGKLVARVETKAAQGFAIQVPGATIVDLGTEFGTAVDAKEGSYVEVSAGKVDVIVRQGERRQLGAGQSLRLTTSGQIDIESSDNKQPPTFAWSLPEKRPPRLLLHWTFDELREDGTAPDASGNGLHGRLEGSMGQANLVEGPTGFGQALALDGRRQRVVLAGPRERALNHTFRELTIAAWIRPQAESAGYFLGKMGGGGERGWQFMVGNRSISLLFFPTAADDGRTVVTAPLDSAVTEQFTHVAATLSADGAVRLYLNGRLVEQAQSPGGMNWRNSANFSVGHRGDSLPKEYFAGAVDDVRIYDRALTNSEILDLLNISSPQEDG